MNQPDFSSASTPLDSASTAAGHPEQQTEPQAHVDSDAVHEPVVREPVVREPVVRETQREVTLERSVRVGRLLIAGIVLGAAVAMLACLFFPIAEDAEYTMGQIVGFMALIGAALGAGLAGALVLVLNAAAKRRRGTGIAVQSDVR